jgi:hypothetical protein
MGEIWRQFVDAFVVPLVQELDSAVESNGKSILDNSLVHMTLECSTVHSDYSKPCLLIGGAGGALTTGHFIDYSRREAGLFPKQGDTMSADPNDSKFGHIYHGTHYNRSLTTILQAMGLQSQDYENPGINTFFKGRTDSLIGGLNNGITNVGGYGHVGPAAGSGGWNTQDLYNIVYGKQNLHFYKDALPFPPGSAT